MKTRNSPKPKKTLPKKTPTPPKPSATPAAATPPSTAATPPSTATATPTTPTSTTTPKTSSEATTAPKQQKPVAAAPAKSSTPKVVVKPKVGEASGSAKPETKTSTEAPKKVVPGTKKTVIKKRIIKVVKPKPTSTPPPVVVGETSKKEEPVAATTTNEASKAEEQVAEPSKEEPVKEAIVETIEKKEDTNTTVVEPPTVKEDEQLEKGVDEEEAVEGTKGTMDNMEEDVEKDGKAEEVLQLDEEEQNVDDDGEEDYGEEGFEEPKDEDLVDDTVSEPEEDAKVLEEEHKEITALAKERRSKKEQEIFVGGLDRDTVEDDIKKAFEVIGKVIDVRLHKNPTTNKNKGYAFVRFADKEHANKALSELKNPLIRGKRCGVAPSEDNDTLFVGNICNTWTKEAIKKKLKEFGLEGIENINLVPDVQQEGLSRGFAFVGFSSHADAMVAYKRLQKPDVVFGHPERTVKVAFAEPLRDPDPEIMAQVKSVFIDGLPQHWDEERVREHFKSYGEIDRVVLARNMPSAKRKDFGFVDFITHEAAIACIEGVNNTELGDDKSKTKVKVRLSNPLPKTQAVKGGLCGGFRIGRPSSGFSRFGRGAGQGARPFNRNNYQRGNESHARGRGRAGRFAGESISEGQYTGYRGRRSFTGQGGRRGHNEDFSTHAGSSSRPNPARSRYGAVERGRGRSIVPRRQPFSSEGRFDRPVGGREYVDDPYLYDDGDYGLKRPYSMLDHEPGYMEPSRVRPRYDHPDPGVSSRGSHYQDSYGPGSSLYSPEYYGSSYGGGAYSSMYGGERSYGGRYYY